MRIGYNPYANSNQSFGMKGIKVKPKHKPGDHFDLKSLQKGKRITPELIYDTLANNTKEK